MYIQFHLTNICNFTCKHCYQLEKSETITFEKYKYCIDQIKGFIKDSDNTIALTGGEPFAIKDFARYIEYAKKQNFKIVILTNGSLLTDQICKTLKRLEIEKLQISLEGPKEINDLIRGPGTFEKITNGIKIAKENNLTVSISNTINELNYNHIEELYDIVSNLNVDFIWFDRMIPYKSDLKSISTEQFIDFLILLKKIKLKSVIEERNTKVRDKRALQFLPGIENDSCFYSCGACEHINIIQNGDIYSCIRMGIKIGNIFENTLFDIYNSEKTMNLIELIHKIPDECSLCNFKEVCRGGLKCLTYKQTKSLDHGDQNCPFINKRISKKNEEIEI